MTATTTGVGRVSRVTGPVVDVEFPVESMPALYNALKVDINIGAEHRVLTLEVAQHIGDNMVRAISMQPTDGLVRGMEAVDTVVDQYGGLDSGAFQIQQGVLKQ